MRRTENVSGFMPQKGPARFDRRPPRRCSSTGSIVTLSLIITNCTATGCAIRTPERTAQEVPAQKTAIGSGADRARPPFQFDDADARFLDSVQRGSFNFFWNNVNSKTGMVPDRSSTTIVSVAGVGFELSALPIGVEHGWVTRDQAAQRALLILSSLANEPRNRKRGMFYHYLDGTTAAPSVEGYERIVSTIDSALLFAGVITASSYFGGDVAGIGDRLISEADWAFYCVHDTKEPWYRGMITLGWKPESVDNPTGGGSTLPFYWADCGEEQRLVTFLAASAPIAERRADPELYYRLRRRLGEWNGETIAWFPWSGAMFASFFAQCWINYPGMGADNPGEHGVTHRASVDWWENSRRMANMHRDKARLNPLHLPTFGENAWGLTASDTAGGYAVPGLFPSPVSMPGARADFDFSPFNPKDEYGDGTIAPYGAGCSILFEPHAAVAALRHYSSIKKPDGTPLVWRDPNSGGYGFLDSFNQGTGWAASDDVAIDQGPLIIAIENARTGLIWKLFHAHSAVRGGMERLGLQGRAGSQDDRTLGR